MTINKTINKPTKISAWLGFQANNAARQSKLMNGNNRERKLLAEK